MKIKPQQKKILERFNQKGTKYIEKNAKDINLSKKSEMFIKVGTRRKKFLEKCAKEKNNNLIIII